MGLRPEMKIVGQTDVGLKRKKNEDTYYIAPDHGFCLVADGMGGAAAGELASRMFAEAAREVFHRFTDIIESMVIRQIKNAYLLANERILNHVQFTPAHKGMGCTAELMAFWDRGFILGHVGDSRTYRFREGELKQLTKDHSLVREQIDKNIIPAKNAKHHRLRNVILRAVGVEERLELDILKGTTHPGDQYLLCSDGLTDMIEESEIENLFGAKLQLNHKAEALVQLALDAGGYDNITVVLVEISDQYPVISDQ
jgi:protein phosphatase